MNLLSGLAAQRRRLAEFVPEPIAVDAAEFRSKFPDITFGLNWEKFDQQAWQVNAIRFTDADALSALRTCFRIRMGNTEPRFLKTIGSTLMPIGMALENFSLLHTKHQKKIADYADAFRAGAKSTELSLPTYRLRKGGQLILDGNHTACALALSGLPFELTLYSIAGPRWHTPA